MTRHRTNDPDKNIDMMPGALEELKRGIDDEIAAETRMLHRFLFFVVVMCSALIYALWSTL